MAYGRAVKDGWEGEGPRLLPELPGGGGAQTSGAVSSTPALTSGGCPVARVHLGVSWAPLLLAPAPPGTGPPAPSLGEVGPSPGQGGCEGLCDLTPSSIL